MNHATTPIVDERLPVFAVHGDLPVIELLQALASGGLTLKYDGASSKLVIVRNERRGRESVAS